MSKEFGSMPLTWKKLGEYNDETDIYLCDQIVDIRRFDEKSNEWNESELKRWLNCEFYRKAFSDEQRKQIVRNEITQDCVFLLSVEEFIKYKRRIAIATDYWWLRSRGNFTSYAAIVHNHSAINDGCNVVINYCVRPAILLMKKAK